MEELNNQAVQNQEQPPCEEQETTTVQNQEPACGEEAAVASAQTVEATPKKSKKKLAIILGSIGAGVVALAIALILLLGGGESGGANSDVKTPKEEAQDSVRAEMVVEILFSTLGGAEISFVDCTFATSTSVGDDFKFSGTVKVRDEYGNFHVANYSAYAEYDSTDGDYDAEVTFGTFRRQ